MLNQVVFSIAKSIGRNWVSYDLREKSVGLTAVKKRQFFQ